MVRAGVLVWADLAWVALASESERVLDFVERSSHRNIQRPTSKIQRQTSNQPSTINHLLTAAICRKPGKLECSRRQIPRPFDN